MLETNGLDTNGLDTIPVVAMDAEDIENLLQFISMAVGISIPLAIIGILTGFHPGQSTKPERVWTMIWFVFGVFFGSFAPSVVEDLRELLEVPVGSMVKFPVGSMVKFPVGSMVKVLSPISFALTYGVGTIGGLVMVGKMLKEYGNCIRLE